MERSQQRLISRLVLVTVTLVVVLVATQPSIPTQMRSQPIINVQSTRVSCGIQPKQIKLYGKVQPISPIQIDSKIHASVEQINFKPGDTIKAGDVLMVLDTATLKLEEAAIQNSLLQHKEDIAISEKSLSAELKLLGHEEDLLKRAKDELRRYTALSSAYKSESTLKTYEDAVSKHAKQCTVHQHKIATFEHQVSKNKQALEIQNAKRLQTLQDIADATIKAPINGVIQRKSVEIGDMAQPGTPLLLISDPDQLFIQAFVPSQYLGQLTPSETKAVLYDQQNVSLTLKRISQVITQGAAHLNGQYYFDNNTHPPLAIGRTLALLTDIQLDVETCPVPESSIYEDRYIYVINQNILERVEISPQGVVYKNGKPWHLISAIPELDNVTILTTRMSAPKSGTEVNATAE